MPESSKITEDDRNLLYENGWAIVSFIAAVNIVLTVIFMLPNFNIFLLFLSVILTIALYRGVSWVKYFHAISFAIYFFVLIGALTGIPSKNYVWSLIFDLILMVYSVAVVYFLLINKSVKEYLRFQKYKRKQSMKASVDRN
jgi:hypothetical protein